MLILERILSFIAPFECLICQTEGSLLCVECSQTILPLPERCYRCHKLSQDSKVCLACRRHSKLSYVWIRTAYEETAKDLIHNFKFERAQAAAEAVAELILDALPYLPGGTVVTYVPTASSRYRQRGYDHAALLAKAISKQRGLVCVSLLARLGQTRQVGSKRQTRTQQLHNAYRARNTGIIKDANILLVDDIITTGATVESAAVVLRAAGARTINATAFAQKQ